MSFAAQPAALEYDLKAVYLYNFLQFFQWPDSRRNTSTDGVMVIGIVGEPPFGNALRELEINIRREGLKSVKFVTLGPYRDGMPEFRALENYNLLFLASSEKHRFATIIAKLKNAPVITVADSEGFLAAGGMINLVQSGGKIRWMINRAAIDRSGLRISAQLLSMALKIYNGN